MRIKNKDRFTKYEFYLISPLGEEVRIPEDGRFDTSLSSLASKVVAQINAFDAHTNNEYSKNLKKRASEKGASFQDYIRLLVEHQICVRNPHPDQICWDSGFGDRIHMLAGKVDSFVEKLPTSFKTIGKTLTKAATFVATGKSSSTLGGCQTCGGTRRMDPSKNNLGRADLLN